MAIPGPEFYKRIYEMRVQRELEGSEIEKQLGSSKESFIKFAAKQRIEHEENLEEEFKEFKNRRKRLIEIDYSRYKKIRNEVFERDDYTCQYCGEVGGRLEVDHIKPFSKGGSEKKVNLVTSCFSCNRSKGDSYLEETDLELINDPRGDN